MKPAVKIRAVVFDLDGLMFNTEDLYDEVGDAMLRARGHRFSRELKLRMMGKPGPVALQIMKDAHQLTDGVAQLLEESERRLEELVKTRLQPMPGLLSLLDRIEQANLPKAVATSSTPSHAHRALIQFDLHARFRFVLTAADVKRGKPDPEIYRLAAQRLGCPTDQLLVLEDSEAGSLAGHAAGAVTVAVPGHHSQNRCFEHAFAVATSLADPLISTLIEGSVPLHIDANSP